MAMLYPLVVRRLGGFLLPALLLLGLSPRAEAGPYSALVVEVESDRVLYQQNPDELRHPASLTKMMTLYLMFEALSQGRISLTDTMVASAHAVSKPPSRLGLKAGETLTVEDGILGLVTQSANDAATVIAETLGGTEPAFADMMTQKARQLGMNSTVFRNAQGLPDPDQWTTAWDMYRLGKALIKNFPIYYTYFSRESFWFKGHEFHNHNHLLGKCEGVDGIKTGFINSSGFNLVASAKRNGVRLVGVVFGGPSHARRDAHMRDILEDGFAQLEGREPSVHLAGFDAPAAKPLLLASAGAVSELAAPVRKPHHHPPPPPVVKAQPHKAAAKPVHKREAPARRAAPVKVAMREADEPHGGKNGKKTSAAASRASAKPAPAHATPAHDKHHGKSASGH